MRVKYWILVLWRSGRGDWIRTSDLTVPNYRKSNFLPLLLSATITLQSATDKPFGRLGRPPPVLPIITECVGIFTEHTHKSPHRAQWIIRDASAGPPPPALRPTLPHSISSQSAAHSPPLIVRGATTASLVCGLGLRRLYKIFAVGLVVVPFRAKDLF